MVSIEQSGAGGAPGLAAPERPSEKDEARELAGGAGFGDQEKTDSADRSAKLAATLQAQAALAGVRVDPIELDDGRQAWIITRWHLTKQCNTLDEVREFLRRMGIAA